MRNLFKIFLFTLLCLSVLSCGKVRDVSVNVVGIASFKSVSYKEIDCVLVLDVNNPTCYKAQIEDINLVVTLSDAVLATIQVESVAIDKKSNKKVAAPTKIVFNDEKFSFLELMVIAKNLSSYDLLCSGNFRIKAAGVNKVFSIKDFQVKQLLQKASL